VTRDAYKTIGKKRLYRANSTNKRHFGGRGVSKNVALQFLFIISLVEVDKTCHMWGGGGV
jgi:hypothetical protein